MRRKRREGWGRGEGGGAREATQQHHTLASLPSTCLVLVILAVLCVALGAWSHGIRTLGLVWDKRRKERSRNSILFLWRPRHKLQASPSL